MTGRNGVISLFLLQSFIPNIELYKKKKEEYLKSIFKEYFKQENISSEERQKTFDNITFNEDVKQKINDRFYVIAPYSSPTKIENENFDSSRTHLNSGTQNDRSAYKPMKNLDGTYKKLDRKSTRLNSSH